MQKTHPPAVAVKARKAIYRKMQDRARQEINICLSTSAKLRFGCDLDVILWMIRSIKVSDRGVRGWETGPGNSHPGELKKQPQRCRTRFLIIGALFPPP